MRGASVHVIKLNYFLLSFRQNIYRSLLESIKILTKINLKNFKFKKKCIFLEVKSELSEPWLVRDTGAVIAHWNRVNHYFGAMISMNIQFVTML